MNSNMMTNKTLYRIQQPILYVSFLPSEFADIFIDIVFVTFVDRISITNIIPSHTVFGSSTIHFTDAQARIPTIIILHVQQILLSHWHVLIPFLI